MPMGGGGKLPLWNHLSYGSQTLWLRVFTFLDQFEKILAKSIGQGVATVIFQMRAHEKLETGKYFLLLKWLKYVGSIILHQKNHFW